ncbi:MAG TPA: Clp protease N-terminal domain-containing protein [Acidimicrobiales bacterium]|nr:Clp protease N-terminal domain-containing protein [Acidimicrobiales bacterium]
MFERFTDRARRVVVLAQAEAQELGHERVGTEHLLLGILREGDGLAGRALTSLGVEVGAVREQVIEAAGRGEATPRQRIPFSPRTKKVLELALREALDLGHDYIGTEHILLGIVREGEGLAAKILVGSRVDLSDVRARVLDLMAQEPASGRRRSPRRVHWWRRSAGDAPADESDDGPRDESG